jgi:hypothetical protein
MVVCTRKVKTVFPILYLTAFGGSKWLYTDTDFEQAKAAECTLICNGIIRVHSI